MCEPVTATLAVAAIGGALWQADVQKKQGEATAKGYEQQAKIDALGKADVLAQGDRESERMLWRTRAALGSQRAAIGAAGIDAGLGTPSELLGETAMFGEIEQQDVRLNAARQAWGYDVSAANNLTGADQARWGGKAQATGTILAGLGQAGGYAAQGYRGTQNPNSYRNNPGYIGPVTRQPIRY